MPPRYMQRFSAVLGTPQASLPCFVIDRGCDRADRVERRLFPAKFLDAYSRMYRPTSKKAAARCPLFPCGSYGMSGRLGVGGLGARANLLHACGEGPVVGQA